ncbi:hypothetical protein SSIM_13285 [Staphylococcus simulans UMC-CNS-990]|uniref:Uncharacterized protein n=1 Tax=Staphylococcus simulans UMC-CNS-990 TaxID=1405498 RepID=A0ABN0P9D6_STASI|nr:hypothetical protein SSIM_13285 [Staphylococcus simulans UMC-CNS-990]KXA46648.1 hypothetical protein HMPREF3215_00699 [Staphylococcus simulans]
MADDSKVNPMNKNCEQLTRSSALNLHKQVMWEDIPLKPLKEEI